MKPEVGTPEYYASWIDCAAIRCGGLIWTGKRHHHCMATIKQATGKRANDFPDEEQGFVTLDGRFVTREEAAELVKQTGQTTPRHRADQLFSEDLY